MKEKANPEITKSFCNLPLNTKQLKDKAIYNIIHYRSDDINGKRHEIISVPIYDLVDGQTTWKEYINSLSPEDLAKQRAYDRNRVKKWYDQNRETREMNIVKKGLNKEFFATVVEKYAGDI